MEAGVNPVYRQLSPVKSEVSPLCSRLRQGEEYHIGWQSKGRQSKSSIRLGHYNLSHFGHTGTGNIQRQG